jgi:hypothetical protein
VAVLPVEAVCCSADEASCSKAVGSAFGASAFAVSAAAPSYSTTAEASAASSY